MAKIYQKIKAFLASADMVHVWLSFVLTVVFVESFDGYLGTKQYDKTGVRGNEFNPKDLLRDAIGCILGIIAVMILVL